LNSVSLFSRAYGEGRAVAQAPEGRIQAAEGAFAAHGRRRRLDGVLAVGGTSAGARCLLL